MAELTIIRRVVGSVLPVGAGTTVLVSGEVSVLLVLESVWFRLLPSGHLPLRVYHQKSTVFR